MKTTYLAIIGLEPAIVAGIKQKLSDPNAKQDLSNYLYKKLFNIVAKRFPEIHNENSGFYFFVDDAIMSEEFFASMGPDDSLNDLPIEYVFEEWLTPEGVWMSDEMFDYDKYKKGYLFTYFKVAS